MPRAYAYFRVAGEHLPLEEISSLVGAFPTEAWSKGDPGRYNPSRPDSGWCLRSPLPDSNTDLVEHIEALLPLLERNVSGIRALGAQYETYLVCVGRYNESISPGLWLSREVVARIAALGLALDADLYFEGN